jgi:hypothetical protein
MPTTLTSPVVQSSVTATLDGWELVLIRKADLTVDLAQSYINADFSFRSAGGAIISRQRLTRGLDQVPAAVKTAGSNFQTALVNAARAAGVLPAGMDVADF